MDDVATSGNVEFGFTGFLTAGENRVREAFIAAIRDECAAYVADAVIRFADARIQRRDTPEAVSGRLTREEMAESLVFYRRRLAGKIAVALVASAGEHSIYNYYEKPAAMAEDLANAICERLAARETGDARGYRSE